MRCEFLSYSPYTDKNNDFSGQKICFMPLYVSEPFSDSIKLNAWLPGKYMYCAPPLSSILSNLELETEKTLKFDSTSMKNLFCVPKWINYHLNFWTVKHVRYKNVICYWNKIFKVNTHWDLYDCNLDGQPEMIQLYLPTAGKNKRLVSLGIIFLKGCIVYLERRIVFSWLQQHLASPDAQSLCHGAIYKWVCIKSFYTWMWGFSSESQTFLNTHTNFSFNISKEIR